VLNEVRILKVPKIFKLEIPVRWQLEAAQHRKSNWKDNSGGYKALVVFLHALKFEEATPLTGQNIVFQFNHFGVGQYARLSFWLLDQRSPIFSPTVEGILVDHLLFIFLISQCLQTGIRQQSLNLSEVIHSCFSVRQHVCL